MKKFAALLAVLLIALTLALPTGAVFDSGTVTAKLKSDVYYMESLDEDTAFFDRNSSKQVPAAAFVKILAAITAIEKWPELDEKVTVSEKNLSLVEYGYGIRTALYKAGAPLEIASAEKLLKTLKEEDYVGLIPHTYHDYMNHHDEGTVYELPWEYEVVAAPEEYITIEQYNEIVSLAEWDEIEKVKIKS